MSEIVAVIKNSPVSIDTDQLVCDWLGFDTANGDACADTIATYKSNFKQFSIWCHDARNIQPWQATEVDLKLYRRFMVDEGAKPSTISLRLTAIRRFFDAAVQRGYLEINPAARVRAPRNRSADTRIKFLTAGEAELLLRSVNRTDVLRGLRDQAMIAFMLIEGLRRVEIERLNTDCFESMPDGSIRVFVRGKGKDGYVYPRDDTRSALETYLNALGDTPSDSMGCPAFVKLHKSTSTIGRRLTRQGINFIVNGYLNSAGVKKDGASCHQLRHTCGTLIYHATRDLRAVQETLRHEKLDQSAVYAQIVNRSQRRFSNEIPLTLKPEM